MKCLLKRLPYILVRYLLLLLMVLSHSPNSAQLQGSRVERSAARLLRIKFISLPFFPPEVIRHRGTLSVTPSTSTCLLRTVLTQVSVRMAHCRTSREVIARRHLCKYWAITSVSRDDYRYATIECEHVRFPTLLSSDTELGSDRGRCAGASVLSFIYHNIFFAFIAVALQSLLLAVSLNFIFKALLFLR